MSSWGDSVRTGPTSSFRGRGRGRGQGPGQGKGRGAAAAAGATRGKNLTWRAEPVVVVDQGSGPDATYAADVGDQEEDGQDGNDNDEVDQEEEEEEDTGEQGVESEDVQPSSSSVPSAFSAFGAASTSAFGGGTTAFGSTLAAPRLSAFSSSPASPFGQPTQPVSAFGPAAGALNAAKTAVSPAPSAVAPTPGQISTLPVLGEDSDARKKRFESSLPDNRYLEMKPLREAQRQRAIKAGLIPDPSKPMRLDEATDFEGTCTEMCPEWEREEREYQNNVDVLERYPGTTRIDPARAVKAFHRPAAGNDQPLPDDVRPPHILESTLDYLFHTLMPTKPLSETHPFIRDRTRSIRQDFTVQNVRGTSAIECNERIARFHVLALGTLREQSGFSESQELEQLRKVLKSLNEFYDDARLADPPIPCPNEAEFRSYNILTHLRDPDIVWSSELLPPYVFDNEGFQLALALHRLAQKSNIARGERAAPNAASRFFKLVARPEVPYLFACILSTHFPQIRRNALEAMKGTYISAHSLFPARTLARILGCDDEAEILDICKTFGIETQKSENGQTVVGLHKSIAIKQATLKPKVSHRLVEAKRGTSSYQDVIDGKAYRSGRVHVLPTAQAPAAAPVFPTPRRTSSSLSAQTPAFPTLPTVRTKSNISSAFDAAKRPSQSVSSASTAVPKLAAPTWPPAPAANNAFAPGPSRTLTPSSTGASSSENVNVGPALNPLASAFTPPSRPAFARMPAAPASSSSAPSFITPVFDTQSKAEVLPTAAPTLAFSNSIRNAVSKGGHLPSPQAPPLIASPEPIHETKRERLASLPRPKPPTQQQADLGPLIQKLTSLLKEKLLAHVASVSARRAAEHALKEHWHDVQLHHHRTREQLASRLADDVLDRFTKLQAARLSIGIAGRERRLCREGFTYWRARTIAQQEEKAVAAERRRRFKAVTADIGLGPHWDGEIGEEDKILEYVDDDTPVFPSRDDNGDDQSDITMAERVKDSEHARKRVWTPGTFLEIVCDRIDHAFAEHPTTIRSRYGVLVSTAAHTSPFATWLASKFALSHDTLSVSKDSDLMHAVVDVHMTTWLDERTQRALPTVCAIVVDCTDDLARHEFSKARTRLRALINAVEEQSIYRCQLFIIACSATSQLTVAEEIRLRAEVMDGLFPDTSAIVPTRLSLVSDLTTAEDHFRAVTTPLSHITLRHERLPSPLSEFFQPLLQVWQAALTMTPVARVDASRFFSTFLEALNGVVKALRDASSAGSSSIKSLPSLDRSRGSFRDSVQSYLDQGALPPQAQLALVSSALLQRPIVPDAMLARVLLEVLADSVRIEVRSGTCRQEAFSTHLPRAIKSLRESLEASVTDLTAASQPAREALKPEFKKRKASSGPPLEMSPKKQQLVDNAPRIDKLSALESLMKDASKLLAR